MTVTTTGARHLLFTLTQPARLPDALLSVLRDEVVLTGWMRASGVLSDVELKVVDPRGGTSAAPQRIAGPVQVVTLEGSIGLSEGDVSCGMRVVLSRETDAGFETIAGDLVSASVNVLEALITAFDEITGTRQLDASGVWFLDPTAGGAVVQSPPLPRGVPAGLPTADTSPAPARPSAEAPARSAFASGFGETVRASEAEATRAAAPAPPQQQQQQQPKPAAPKPSSTFSGGATAMPTRIARPIKPEEEEQAVPEPGDYVDHFAFGRCEVVKTDGDRLHLRLGKDQRIKEIALEMLRVSPLPAEEGQTGKFFRLARKL
jgi:predicted DNA-binding protein with PD1-like motif